LPIKDTKINKKALTLFEILVSVVILALVITGLANVFVAGKRYIKYSRLRMGGGEIGKRFLDPLQTYVRQNDWNTSTNRLGVVQAWPGSVIDQYTPSYVSSNKDGIRKVIVTIDLPEID
jgi:Tfp pilus assembly protein PilV